MSTDSIVTRRPIWTWLIIVIGFVLLGRLCYLTWESFRVVEAQPIEEFQEQIRKGAENERRVWEESWRKSGAPPPPGGFDAAWKRAHGTQADFHAPPSAAAESAPSAAEGAE